MDRIVSDMERTVREVTERMSAITLNQTPFLAVDDTIVYKRYRKPPKNPFSIYLIKNLINDKVYVGQTIKTIHKRFLDHSKPSGSRSHLRNSINKHGRENFTITLLTVCGTQETADYWERYFIAKYDSRSELGYNIVEGGGGNAGMIHSQETRQMLSDLRMGKPGPKHTEETKARLSEANKGEKNPQFGKVHSYEWKREHSEALLGSTRIYHEDGSYHYGTKEEAALAPNQAEYKSRNKAPLHSEESKRKISEGQTGNKRGVRIYHEDGTSHFGSIEEASMIDNQEEFRERFNAARRIKSRATKALKQRTKLDQRSNASKE